RAMHPSLDFFTPTKYSDVILIVGRKKLHVSKQILASRSSYFETLFYGEFKEENESEVTIEGVKYRQFTILLNMIYGECENDWFGTYTLVTVDQILKLADRFHMPTITRECEKILIEDKHMGIAPKMLLADRFRLSFLMDNCLVKLETP
ncbi:hypothetical protein PFISCL1PPCAC_20301, partial [Pristionchus fissidentatus]